MVNGLYTARNSMMLLQDKMDNNASNLANSHTTGYKKSFMVTLSRVDIGRNDQQLLHQDENQRMSENRIDFEQGNLVSTGNPFDIAIEGDAFFKIESPNGYEYTRAGALTVNSDGKLATLNGHLVMDESNAAIQIQGKNFSVGESGNLYTDNRLIGKLNMVTFENPAEDLERVGHNAYRPKPDVESIYASDFKLKQGMTEASNVNVIDGMVEMIKIARQNEMNQKMVTSMDETLGKAVNEIGRVS